MIKHPMMLMFKKNRHKSFYNYQHFLLFIYYSSMFINNKIIVLYKCHMMGM
jgi:hypothetical protein